MPSPLLRVFPRLSLVTCSPVFGKGYMFSRACHWLHVFPRLSLVTCFLALGTSYMFSRAWHWLHVFPSIEAFCLRMLHKTYFNVSNRWYAPDLNKQNGDSCDKLFGNGSSLFLFSVCNLSVSVRKSTKWFFGVL